MPVHRTRGAVCSETESAYVVCRVYTGRALHYSPEVYSRATVQRTFVYLQHHAHIPIRQGSASGTPVGPLSESRAQHGRTRFEQKHHVYTPQCTATLASSSIHVGTNDVTCNRCRAQRESSHALRSRYTYTSIQSCTCTVSTSPRPEPTPPPPPQSGGPSPSPPKVASRATAISTIFVIFVIFVVNMEPGLRNSAEKVDRKPHVPRNTTRRTRSSSGGHRVPW